MLVEETVFGHPYLTIFGQSIQGQYVCFSGFTICAARKSGSPEGWGPLRVGANCGAPKGGVPTILRFFSLSRPIFALFVSLSGCLLVEFWWFL